MDLGELFHGTNPLFTDVALLVGRATIGVCFMIHAFGKLGWVGNGTLDGFASWLADLGVPMPAVQARMAMISELAESWDTAAPATSLRMIRRAPSTRSTSLSSVECSSCSAPARSPSTPFSFRRAIAPGEERPEWARWRRRSGLTRLYDP
jgi:hypothetical protein